MARIKKSAAADGVKGKIGDLIFARVRGAAVVKRHIQGPDRKSDSQLSVRSAFTIVKDSWLELDYQVINCWTRFAADLKGTGYNFFLSANVAAERADDWRILTPLNYKVAPVASVSMESGPEEGEATISWEAGSANPSHKAWVFVREVEVAKVKHLGSWKADVSAGSLVVNGLETGKFYRFYLAVHDISQVPGWRFSESVECLGEAEAPPPPPTVWFSDGFETGNFNVWTGTQMLGDDMFIEISAIRTKAGTKSALVTIEDAVSGNYANVYKTNFAALGSGSEIWASGWFFFPTGFDANEIMKLFYIADTNWKAIHAKLNTSRQLYITKVVGGVVNYYQDSPIIVPLNQWVGIELYSKIDPAGGVLQMWQDKVKLIDVGGLDTYDAADFAHAAYGATLIYGTWPGPDEFWFDEVYIQNQQKIK